MRSTPAPTQKRMRFGFALPQCPAVGGGAPSSSLLTASLTHEPEEHSESRVQSSPSAFFGAAHLPFLHVWLLHSSSPSHSSPSSLPVPLSPRHSAPAGPSGQSLL